MSSSPAVEPTTPSVTPSATPSSPAIRAPDYHFQTSTPNYLKKQHQPLSVVLSATAPSTPPTYGEPTLTPPPRSPGVPLVTPASGDGRSHPPDGTSSDKSSETAVGGVPRAASTALSRKESYKAQRQHYRREKKRAASALLHSIEDPSVVVLADWLKVRGSLKSWTKLWCVLKPGLLLLYKSPKAKRSHWVGTVLLTSCQVIERPSKKDGFCFKLYHPLEQSIWAPRGPHNETIGAVVQPLPTAHLIFRAPSQAAGHCWLDGLELALRCSNAMLRCSRSRPEQAVEDAPASQTNISHEELEKHFNEHALRLPDSPCSSPSPLLSVLDYSPKSSRSDYKKLQSKSNNEKLSKSLSSSPFKMDSKLPILGCFELPKLSFSEKWNVKERTPIGFVDENLSKSIVKRRSSTPSMSKSNSVQKRMCDFRESGVKTDSDETLQTELLKRRKNLESEVIFSSPENFLITKTAPSVERFPDSVDVSSSSEDGSRRFTPDDVPSLGSTSQEGPLGRIQLVPRAGSLSPSEVSRPGPPTGDAVKATRANSNRQSEKKKKLAGAASDTDSEGSRPGMPDSQNRDDPGLTKQDILARIESFYVEDPDREIGVAGELVEEVAEENKSLLWFLLKQVRPGMDLSKVVLPTFILEPRSFLDKLSDNYYHADLLSQAQTYEDPYQRFKGVLKWYLSGLYRKPKGLKKPYNPVLGETFRCCWRHRNNQNYTYYVAEQVSHHPPISAFYISNRQDGFVIEGSLLARSKFYGNSTSAILEGCARVQLLNWGETYITTAPYAHCKGIVIGTLSMELGGKIHIICEESGYSADVEFKLRSFLGGADQTNAISGRIKRGKDTIASVEGYWDGRIDIKDKRTGEESNLLDVAVLKEQRLPRYIMKIERQKEWESQRLWLKVSEAILNEDQIVATEEKTIIEEAQRTRARNLVAPWVPRLFHRDTRSSPPEGLIDQGWRYNHSNTSPWQPEELIEYEEDFLITTLKAIPIRTTGESRMRELAQRSDSDSHDDLARRSKTSTPRQLEEVKKLEDHTLDKPLRPSDELQNKELAQRADLDSPDDVEDRRQSKTSTSRQTEEVIKEEDYIATSLKNALKSDNDDFSRRSLTTTKKKKEENDFVAKLMQIPEIRELEHRTSLENHDNLPTTAQRESKSYTQQQAEEDSKEGEEEKLRKVSMIREHYRTTSISQDNLATTSRRRTKSYSQQEKEKILREDFVTKLMKIPEIRELAERSGLETRDELKMTDRSESKTPTPRQPEEITKTDEDFVAKLLKIPRVRELAQRSGLEIHEDLATSDQRESRPPTPWQPEEALKLKDDLIATSQKSYPIRTSIDPRINDGAPRSDSIYRDDLTGIDRRSSKPSTLRESKENVKRENDFVTTSPKNETVRTSIESRTRELAAKSDLDDLEDLVADRRQSKPSTPRQPEETLKLNDDFIATSLKNELKGISIESGTREHAPTSDLDKLGDLAASYRRQSKPSTPRNAEEALKLKDDEPRRTSIEPGIRDPTPTSEVDKLGDLATFDPKQAQPSIQRPPDQVTKLNDDLMSTSLNTERRRTSVESRLRESTPRSDLDSVGDLTTMDRRQSKLSTQQKPGDILKVTKDDFDAKSLNIEPRQTSSEPRIKELPPKSDLDNLDFVTDRRQSNPSTPLQPEEVLRPKDATSFKKEEIRTSVDSRVKELPPISELDKHDDAPTDRRQSKPNTPRPQEVIEQEDDFAATSVFNVPTRVTGETRIRDPPRSDANKNDAIATDRRQSKNSTPHQREDDFVATSLKELPTRTTAETKLRELTPTSDLDKHDDLVTTASEIPHRRRSKTTTPKQPEEVKKDELFTTSLKDLPKRTSADTKLRELDLNTHATSDRRKSKIATPRQSEDIVKQNDLIDLKFLKEQKRSSGESRRRQLSRLSDSDNPDDLERLSGTSGLSIKQTLFSIDTTLREHSMAIDRLTRKLESLAESHRATVFRVQTIQNVTTPTQTIYLYSGLVLAIVLQMFLTWIFYYRN